MITRFAPSPTGWLHLGHAFSAMTGHDRATAAGGRFLLRIEDCDRARCRPEYEVGIYTDLHWLGLKWEEPVLRQSDHLPDYTAALGGLIDLGLCYPCNCTRADIQAALSAPQEGVTSPSVYPGKCRHRLMASRTSDDAIRLDMGRALAMLGTGRAFGFTETGPEQAGFHPLEPVVLIETVGDIVLSRKDIGAAAYHLAVVVDDARQSITEVTRGMDLFDATPIHVLLQALLGLPQPTYHHHRLIRDDTGKRLAKRDDARSIRHYRANGATPADIRRMIGL